MNLKVGDKLYLVGIRNSFCRHIKAYYIISKIGNKYIYLDNPPYSNFKINKQTLREYHDISVNVYIDEQEYLDKLLVDELKRKIYKYVSGYKLNSVNDKDKLLQIVELLGCQDEI